MDQLTAPTVIVDVARFALAVIFLPSGLRKLRDPSGFVTGVRNYGILPARLAVPVARSIAVAETVLGLVLLAGIALAVAAAAAALLLVCFVAGISVNLRRGRDIDCSCYGLGATKNIGPAALGRNAALFLLASSIIAAAALQSDALWFSPGLGAWAAHDVVGATVPLVVLVSAVLLAVYLLEWGIEVRRRGSTAIRSMGGVTS